MDIEMPGKAEVGKNAGYAALRGDHKRGLQGVEI